MDYLIKDKRHKFVRRERRCKGPCGPCKKTGGKLSLNIEYDDGVDTGPTRLKESKYGQYGYSAFADGMSWYCFDISRYLRSKVGQKWDDVYKELSAIVDHRSWNAKDFYKHNIRVGFPLDWWDDFGVDENGLLREYEYKRKPKPQEEVNFVEVDNVREYQKIKNIWYYIERSPNPGFYYYVNDRPERFRRDVTLKHQLGKKALRDFKRDLLPKGYHSDYVGVKHTLPKFFYFV